MKIPTITPKRALEVTMNDASKRLMKLDGLDNKAFKKYNKEWIEASEGRKDQPHVLYANQINIEQN